MPYHLINRAALKENPELIEKLAPLVLEDPVERARSIEEAKKIISKEFKRNGFTALVSTSPEGKPKAFISFWMPKTKQGIIVTVRSFTSEQYRSRTRGGQKRQKAGGEQKRLFLRLTAIARRQGIREIYAPTLSIEMLKFYRGLAENPRLDLGKKGLRQIRQRIKIWNEMPKTEKSNARKPELIYSNSPEIKTQRPKAVVAVKPMPHRKK